MLSQSIMIPQSVRSFFNIPEAYIRSNGYNTFPAVCLTGMAARTAADIQDFITRFYGKAAKVDCNHE
jgi:hypothetical protein